MTESQQALTVISPDAVEAERTVCHKTLVVTPSQVYRIAR